MTGTPSALGSGERGSCHLAGIMGCIGLRSVARAWVQPCLTPGERIPTCSALLSTAPAHRSGEGQSKIPSPSRVSSAGYRSGVEPG